MHAEVFAVNNIPRGGMDNCVLSVASGRGKEAAALLSEISYYRRSPLAGDLPPTGASDSTFEVQLAAVT